MASALLYDTESLVGAYDPAPHAGDFCAEFDRVGLVFSLSFHGEDVTYVTIDADLTVALAGRTRSGSVPGRFMPANRSLTGAIIPIRVFLALPFEWMITPAELRASNVTIHSIRRAQGESIFDSFRVAY